LIQAWTSNKQLRKQYKVAMSRAIENPTMAQVLSLSGHEVLFLDRSFWSSLGKAMRWYEYEELEFDLSDEKDERRQELINLEENKGVILRIGNQKGVAIVTPFKKLSRGVNSGTASSTILPRENGRRLFQGFEN
jgi:hypothetical protein